MGNRTCLTFGNYCQFDANNCLPITWLALFTPQDFLTQEQEEDGDKSTFILYRTTRELAIQRIENVINKTKKNSAVWSFLRPLGLLKDELELCPASSEIELNMTQFWSIDSVFEQKTTQAASIFTSTINGFIGNGILDIKTLSELVKDFSLGNISSVSNLNSEEKMYVLIGFYEGNPEHEKLYSIAYFNDDYWKA